MGRSPLPKASDQAQAWPESRGTAVSGFLD